MRELPLQNLGQCCYNSSWWRYLAWTEWGGGYGGASTKITLKVPEDCASGCRWGGRRLSVEMGEVVGQGGHFNDDNPFKWAEKCP